MTACHIINRLPTSVLKGQSPFQVFFGKPTDVTHLKVFGCLCYSTVLKPSHKFAPRAKPAVFLGYATTQKGYYLYG